MALVTVQRSPSIGNSPQSSVSPRRGIADICRFYEPFQQDSGTGGSLDEEDPARSNRSLSECYFAGKGAAVVLPASQSQQRAPPPQSVGRVGSGAAPGPPPTTDIHHHLQSMFYLLRPDETLKMAVKLESVHPNRTRYLVVVSCVGGRTQAEESCLLGIDCNHQTTVGLVLKVLADTTIKLDGDGGFKVNICNRQHIFKPVSVQAMWSALQTLYRVSGKAREENYFEGGVTHEWVDYYEQRIQSEQSCLNEWHAMDNLESKRPPSPDSNKSTQRESTEESIRSKLKEIMMAVDLDEVTSKQVRTQLEQALACDLGEYKPFIDQEMLVILGQMDAATEIFPHVYLGSEWNASNLDELSKNGVCHILNVTREIDNFFPGMFDYLNIRVYDDEKTDLLLHLENTFKYITKAQKEGSKVLVHCKMGVSRSASVVIAYAMKAYDWDLKKALEYVQKKRNCIKPNKSFITQLETYQGILEAKKNKEKLQRTEGECVSEMDEGGSRMRSSSGRLMMVESSASAGGLGELIRLGGRPKSWSPDHSTANALFPSQQHGPTTLSLERLNKDNERQLASQSSKHAHAQTTEVPTAPRIVTGSSSSSVNSSGGSRPAEAHNYNIKMMQIPCDNGPLYSVSQNKILQLSSNQSQESVMAASVKHRVNALESATAGECQPTTPSLARKDRKAPGLVLNLTSQFEEPPPASLVKKEEPWDPGEAPQWTSASETSTIVRKKDGDPFSNRLDRVFDREERKQQRNVPSVVTEEEVVQQPTAGDCEVSRQSSWSSYDSAVVLRDCVSRQSSWGSADTRSCTLPSRNSSWGSYDLRPSNHDSWAAGTVKRTKQKLEENGTDTVKRVCPEQRSEEQTFKVPFAPFKDSETSSNVSNITRSVSVDESKLSSNITDETSASTACLSTSADNNQKCTSGFVKNLRKEFEAKSVSTKKLDRNSPSEDGTSKSDDSPTGRVQSLPSSPVSEKSDRMTVEDLSVRKLVGRYEAPERPRLSSSESDKRLSQPPVPLRKSSLDVQPHAPVVTKPFANPIVHSFSNVTTQQNKGNFSVKSSMLLSHNLKNSARPPTIVKPSSTPSPSVVVASVVAKAQSKKQQQGKTHPLARLTINKQRHNNPVYNTM